MSRVEEARRLRAKAEGLRSEAAHLEALGEPGVQALRRLANGFDRDATRYEHRCGDDNIVVGGSLRPGWKRRSVP
jgi:hypothetical protein